MRGKVHKKKKITSFLKHLYGQGRGSATFFVGQVLVDLKGM